MRKDYSQWPSVAELENTMSKEVKREVIPNKKEIHYASLDPFLNLVKILGYKDQSFDITLPWQEVHIASERVINDLIPLILSADFAMIKEPAIAAYRYLAEEDEPQKSDLILTFGAKTPLRVEKTVELYKKGLALRVLFTGKGPTFIENVEETEAVKYKKMAVETGISEDAILTETEAITLPDNVRRSLNLLERLGINYQRVILVNSPYAQRRGYGIFMKNCPEGIEVFRVNCGTKDSLKEDQWFKNEEGIKYVVGEYCKIWISLSTNII